ncbi:galactose oxidase-like domain-containing protein [Streptomyces europaeiscabiei]|uniref:kelch motif-containing protein n=1 Tax=Streptomyces europaeiscabiei TaxID=146819 RepID=UPI00062836B6|nr:kelch motif-containing protein [Streptomyces europaeiscabiei]MDX2765605.1 kelch motif-containing protein [Streptomyces europaeiscabiei]MDX2774890.1 kelch motif-containing protein [Streptomyces europaeiscabiei]MDX3672417.1 kelch motif-containing protein [Streptomyces europaeiscabiei]MDX3713853.1 kelch motif-containing protein [Streptomyces europaeiscabiei]MDX3783693.1 kelch motif-containing protein [Streptomyces europaeiscabiei]
MAHQPPGKTRKYLLGVGAVALLAGLNAPAAIGFAQERYHEWKIAQPGYRAEYGSWTQVDIPKRFRTNAIHAALLHTGKVLIVAGSGNEQRKFDKGSFDTVLWDPARNTYKKIPTPVDFFCAGHAQLPDGRLLVAGGTARYELLDGEVERAGGGMRVKNENPDKAVVLKKGTRFRSPTGIEYVSRFDVTVPKARRSFDVTYDAAGAMRPWKTEVVASEARVFVEAVDEGAQSVMPRRAQYEILGLKGEDAANTYGLSEKITLDKQDFQGIRAAYEFDPKAERYVPVAPMRKARWYPTLVGLADGRVLAVSGLDDVGVVDPGDNEIYDPRTRKWKPGPKRYFPTYPALFLTRGGKLFYPASNAGYGPDDLGREPGLWDLRTNRFQKVKGLTDPDRTETSASVLLPPAQDQKVMILGGGGVGESRKATSRTAVIDLKKDNPAFEDGPDLPRGTRYLNSVLMPDDTVFTSNGSADYRGRGASNILTAQFYDPESNSFRGAAAPRVGRNYHSEALLLPDGRVATFGSDPLYDDRRNTKLGHFEQRMEIYTPPLLHKYGRKRPVLGDGPQEVDAKGRATFATAHPERVADARLMRPSAVTHSTDVEQRSIALEVTRTRDSVTVDVPSDRTLVPPGWYMLFVTDGEGTPSKAKWIQVK